MDRLEVREVIAGAMMQIASGVASMQMVCFISDEDATKLADIIEGALEWALDKVPLQDGLPLELKPNRELSELTNKLRCILSYCNWSEGQEEDDYWTTYGE